MLNELKKIKIILLTNFQNKKNIKEDNDKQIYECPDKTKIDLKNGEKVFDYVENNIENFRSKKNDPFVFNKDICIPVSTTKEQLEDKYYLKNKVDELNQKNRKNRFQLEDP